MRLLAFAAALCCTVALAASGYPDHPLRLIVPFAPGGGNDAVARTVAQKMSAGLGQPVVVDNRAGAGGVLGAEVAAKSPADGYVLFLGGVGSHAINPLLHKSLPYDPVKDFAPVALIASAPLLVVVNPALPVKTLPELIEYLKAHPGTVNYASNGNGSSSHLATVMFETATGTRMTHVPYKGLSPALVDLLAGQVQLMFSSVVAIVPQVQAGKLRALAVTGKQRLAALPDVPTVAEAAVPGYEAGSWYGILVPAGTPRDIVMALNAQVNDAIRAPEVRRSLEKEGALPIGGTPEDFAAHIRGELDRLGKVVRDAKLGMQ